MAGMIEPGGQRHDCVIVGAGPAGLTAAVYLGRFLRRVLVLHDGTSRAALIPTSHNFPGYSDGISGIELLAELERQALAYGAAIDQAEVTEIEKRADTFIVRTSTDAIAADRVILATGAIDVSPDIPGLRGSIFDGQVRYCPICDGYEAMDKRIAVLGPLVQAMRKAEFLRTYTGALTIVSSQKPSPEDIKRLHEAGIGIEAGQIREIERAQDLTILLGNGKRLTFDIIYPAMGCSVRSELGTALGAETDEAKALKVDPHQQTTVKGLYAIGDVVSCLDQIAVGTGHAAIAATAIHNSLRSNRRGYAS